jgi:hypothetical protein
MGTLLQRRMEGKLAEAAQLRAEQKQRAAARWQDELARRAEEKQRLAERQRERERKERERHSREEEQRGQKVSFKETQRRRVEAGGLQGDITVTVAWNSADDLDLHCETPGGGHIHFGNKEADGGTLDMDCRGGKDAAENIWFNDPLHGRYRFWVHQSTKREIYATTAFAAVLNVHDRMEKRAAEVAEGEELTVFEFDYSGRSQQHRGTPRRRRKKPRAARKVLVPRAPAGGVIRQLAENEVAGMLGSMARACCAGCSLLPAAGGAAYGCPGDGFCLCGSCYDASAAAWAQASRVVALAVARTGEAPELASDVTAPLGSERAEGEYRPDGRRSIGGFPVFVKTDGSEVYQRADGDYLIRFIHSGEKAVEATKLPLVAFSVVEVLPPEPPPLRRSAPRARRRTRSAAPPVPHPHRLVNLGGLQFTTSLQQRVDAAGWS